MQLPILTTDTAPEASRPILEGIAAELGFVPNLAAAIAASPTLLTAFDALRRAVGDPSVVATHREVAGLAVGVAVDNQYGVAFHSTMLGMLGVDEAEIERMRAGSEPTGSAALAAVYALARAVVLERGAVPDTLVRRAVDDAGLDTAALLQIVTECVFAGLVGIVDNLAGRVELDTFLEPRAWK